MRLRLIFSVLVSVVSVHGVCAQHHRFRQQAAWPDTARFVSAYTDSLLSVRARIDTAGLCGGGDGPTADGRYFRLFAPLTFYHSPAARSFEITQGDSCGDAVAESVNGVLLDVYLNRPDLVRNSERHLRERGTIRTDIDRPMRHDIDLVDMAEPVPDEPVAVPVRVVVRRPNFWTFSGDHNLQFLQNFISENWHKGGESNYAMMASVTLNANYDNKRRLKWDNKLELKLGFQTSRSDTLHKFRTSEDLIRYTGKVGLQAANRWYYTVQLLAYTQFMRGLKSNDKKVYSDFMSPFNLNIGIGMDYSVNTNNKRLTGTVNLSVLSFNFRYVDRKDLAAANGVVGDHHTLEDFGSQLTTNLTWKISDMVKWQTRLYCFTTYKRALVEWENTVTLNVSRFISANIFFYPRFDDSTARDSDWNYWQFKEYSSLGFCYSF